MNRFLAIACLLVASVVGCKKGEPTPSLTPVANPPKETPTVPDSLATTRESASGLAATKTPPASQPGH